MARDGLRAWLIRSGLDGTARGIRHPLLTLRSGAARRWSRNYFRSTEALAREIDPALWDETTAFAAALESRHRDRFEELRASIRLGGGGDHRLLYFMTRLTRPAVVVETGVAAGWSSAAILAAMDRNGHGHLWSSELVYDRPWLHDDYRPFVGMVVDPTLHDRWTLLLEGDRVNLPVILDASGPIDLFHFDSDKSLEGRRFAFELVQPRLAPTAVVIVDDINDNRHFRRLAASSHHPFTVTGRRGTVGLIWSGLAASG